MNFSRYTFSAAIAIGAHVLMVTQLDDQKAYAMPAGSNSTKVSINLIAASPSVMSNSSAAPLTNAQKETTPAEPKKTTPKLKPIAEKKPTLSKPLKQNHPSVKPVPKNKITTKTSTKPVKSVKKIDTPVTKTEHSTKMMTKQDAKKGVSEQPILIDQPDFISPPTKPRYPRLAQRKGIEGTATYEIWLDETGQQIKRTLVSSSGANMLDAAALDAIKKWKFTPRKVNGISMAHRVQIPIRFKLD